MHQLNFKLQRLRSSPPWSFSVVATPSFSTVISESWTSVLIRKLGNPVLTSLENTEPSVICHRFSKTTSRPTTWELCGLFFAF
ncbi:hypothetical protein Nepgr_028569 [Nepenthes gracilis]|uniref:Uncharacterized protein n=1 Tax=Nepenthes gracilis TaxID=150966 RepID=A0AAD3TCS7_NEPGR|nr:hypothetical protein Nepgr_028569 [Nepenthes gracilis]